MWLRAHRLNYLEGGSALARALHHTPQLRALNLGYSSMRSEGIIALAEALPYLPQLQTLKLRCALATTAGVPQQCVAWGLAPIALARVYVCV
jgi:hypothetical protein